MAFIFKETLVHSAFFYNFRIWSSGWLISRKMDRWRAGGWIDRGERGRGRGGPHGTIKAPSCAVVCWPPILLLTCDYSKNPRLRNWLLRTCSTKICQLGTDHYIFDEGGGGGGVGKCWKKFFAEAVNIKHLYYTRKNYSILIGWERSAVLL